MTPDQVLNAVYDQLRPLVIELAKYSLPNEEVKINFEVGEVTFKFK